MPRTHPRMAPPARPPPQENGPTVKAGDATASEFHKRITFPFGDDDRMPAEGESLTADQIAAVKTWINEGANWPDDAAIQVAAAKPAPTVTKPETVHVILEVEDRGSPSLFAFRRPVVSIKP